MSLQSPRPHSTNATVVLAGYATKLRAGAPVDVKLVKALREVADSSLGKARSGHVFGDYLAVVSLLADSEASELKSMAGCVRMLNLVTRGSDIETVLADTWRRERLV